MNRLKMKASAGSGGFGSRPLVEDDTPRSRTPAPAPLSRAPSTSSRATSPTSPPPYPPPMQSPLSRFHSHTRSTSASVGRSQTPGPPLSARSQTPGPPLSARSQTRACTPHCVPLLLAQLPTTELAGCRTHSRHHPKKLTALRRMTKKVSTNAGSLISIPMLLARRTAGR